MVPQFKPKDILMLGFADGTTAGLIRLIHGKVPITAVDIKPCKSNYGVKFFQADAREFIKTCNSYDCVIVDLFSDKDEDPSDFIFSEEFVKNLKRICNYLIINITSENDMHEYRKVFGRFGSNKPNRLSNRIYYYGNKDYNHLIIR